MMKNKNKVLSFRVTADEYNSVSRLAKSLGKRKSQMFNQLIHDPKVVIKSPKSEAKIRDSLGHFSTLASELISRWGHAGDNINQIARALNTSLKSSGRIDFEQLQRVTGLVADLHSSSNTLTDDERKLVRGVTNLWHIAE